MSQTDIKRSDAQATLSQDAQTRQEHVLGNSPRIAPLDSSEIADLAIEVTKKIRRAAGSSTPVTASTIPKLVATLLRHPDLFQRIADLSGQLQANGALAPSDRQLAILRTTWLLQAPYAWGEHVKHSKRIGFTSEKIERATLGSAAPGWDEHEQAILSAVEQLHESATISDATWEILAKRLDEKQLLEIPVVIGHFTAISYLQNAIRLRLDDGNAGLQSR